MDIPVTIIRSADLKSAPRSVPSSAHLNPHAARMSAPNSALAPRSVNKYAHLNPLSVNKYAPSVRLPSAQEDVCMVDVQTGVLAEVTVVIAAITAVATHPGIDIVSLQMRPRSRMYQGNGKPISLDRSI